METINLAIGLLSSLLSSVVGSFAGGGSSLILFPLLLLFAQGTYASLLTANKISATFWVGISGYMHWKRNSLDMRLIVMLIIAGLLGTALGTYFVQYQLNELLFKRILAGVLLCTSIYLMTVPKKGLEKIPQKPIRGWWLAATVLFSCLINILNGMFGGTGIFITLWLVIVFGMTFMEAIPYTIVSYAIINIPHTAWLVATEPVEPWLVAGVIFGAIVGSWTGTKLLYLKGNKWVKIAAVSVMLVIGIRTLISAI